MKTKIRIKKIKFLIFILNVFFLILPSAISHAKEGFSAIKSLSMQAGIKSGNTWNVKAYQKDKPDSDRSAAKICFKKESGQEECFTAEGCMENSAHTFQHVKELREILLFRNGLPRNGILFISESSSGGSGYYDLLSIWEYNENNDKFSNILPMIGITEQGEYRLMKIGKSGNSILVVADYLLRGGETHFDPHRYLVSIYMYDELPGKYYLKAQFITKRKYNSFNDVDGIDVIRHEKGNIKRLILLK